VAVEDVVGGGVKQQGCPPQLLSASKMEGSSFTNEGWDSEG